MNERHRKPALRTAIVIADSGKNNQWRLESLGGRWPGKSLHADSESGVINYVSIALGKGQLSERGRLADTP